MTLTRTNWPDVDDVISLNGDPEAVGDVGDHRPMAAARILAEEMPRLMAHNRRADRLGSWVARDRETGSFIGWFMIRPVDEPLRTVELTYRLRQRACGRGYDVEGILAMVEMARAAQMSTVVATVAAIDIASRRLMESAGLRLVHELPPSAAGPASIVTPTGVAYALDLSADAPVLATVAAR